MFPASVNIFTQSRKLNACMHVHKFKLRIKEDSRPYNLQITFIFSSKVVIAILKRNRKAKNEGDVLDGERIIYCVSELRVELSSERGKTNGKPSMKLDYGFLAKLYGYPVHLRGYSEGQFK